MDQFFKEFKIHSNLFYTFVKNNPIMKKYFNIILFLLVVNGYAQQTFFKESIEQKQERMQWFKDAKLGIFIHWGVYAVNGIDESWSFYNGYISHKDYLKQLEGFTASNYQPQKWAELIKESGAI